MQRLIDVYFRPKCDRKVTERPPADPRPGGVYDVRRLYDHPRLPGDGHVVCHQSASVHHQATGNCIKKMKISPVRSSTVLAQPARAEWVIEWVFAAISVTY